MHRLSLLFCVGIANANTALNTPVDLSRCERLKQTPYMMNIFTEELRKAVQLDDDYSSGEPDDPKVLVNFGDWWHNTGTFSDLRSESYHKLRPEDKRGFVLVGEIDDLGDDICTYVGLADSSSGGNEADMFGDQDDHGGENQARPAFAYSPYFHSSHARRD